VFILEIPVKECESVELKMVYVFLVSPVCLLYIINWVLKKYYILMLCGHFLQNCTFCVFTWTQTRTSLSQTQLYQFPAVRQTQIIFPEITFSITCYLISASQTVLCFPVVWLWNIPIICFWQIGIALSTFTFSVYPHLICLKPRNRTSVSYCTTTIIPPVLMITECQGEWKYKL